MFAWFVSRHATPVVVEPVVDGTLVGLDGSPWDAVEPGAFGVRVGEVSV
ncbi:hypothetical protein ACFXGA_36175 [Actinosynnema sp. NPDC059335]